jgi:hypothetical protein
MGLPEPHTFKGPYKMGDLKTVTWDSNYYRSDGSRSAFDTRIRPPLPAHSVSALEVEHCFVWKVRVNRPNGVWATTSQPEPLTWTSGNRIIEVQYYVADDVVVVPRDFGGTDRANSWFGREDAHPPNFSHLHTSE